MADFAGTTMSADDAARLAEFARACKAAARAVSLYPGTHPAIGVSLGRLADLTARLTQAGPFRLQVGADRLIANGASAAKPDPAIAELASLLHRHLVGAITLNAGANIESWKTLLSLLARSPEEVRADGGIGRLWAAAGGPGVELQEIDYAELLREKQGADAALDEIVAAALAGRQLRLDESGMRLLLEIVGDPARLAGLIDKVGGAAASAGADAQTAAFLSLARGLADWAGRHEPAQLEPVLDRFAQAAGRLSADAMLGVLAERLRPDSPAREIASAVIDRISDSTISRFVAKSVVEGGGATDRLAQAFQALVPDTDRRRQLLSLAEADVAASELGEEDGFEELWQRVEGLLTSYSDESFVSDEYGRELSAARAQAVDVDRISDDPPERLAAWLGTVADAALRDLDDQLLRDLLAIETDPLRWRDVAETVMTQADALVRVDRFEEAWRLAEVVVRQSRDDAARLPHATPALERFGRGGLMKHVGSRLRTATDDGYERFKALCHAIGPPVIASLAEALSAEQDARSRRRLRDILIGFGARGREAVQQLMHAPNWEVRRTAAFLLREFGGSEGLKELVPLLADNEPLVQREAIQALLLNGSDEASRILLTAIETTTGRPRDTLLGELGGARTEAAAPFFRYLIRHLDRRKQPRLYLMAIEAIGRPGATESVDALRFALYHGDWTSPFDTKRLRAAAAGALRRVGTPAALDVLREAAERGPRGVRAIARATVEE